MKKFNIEIAMTNEQYDRSEKAALKKGQTVEEFYENIMNSDKFIILPKWFMWVTPLLSGIVISIVINLLNRIA